jgi:hypothetical protein
MAARPLQLGPVLLTWAGVIFKLPALRRSPHDAALRAYWLGLVGIALTLTVLLPPVQLAVDRLVGVPNLARPLGHALALAAGWSVQSFLLLLSYPAATARRGIRRRGWVLAGTLVLMATLFALAPVEDETTLFMSRYADAPFIPEYWLVFLTSLAMVGWNVVRLCWRYARLSERPVLRLGLRLTAAGGLFGLCYIVNEGLYIATRRLGLGYPLRDHETVTQLLLAIAAALIVIGSTIPAWGPRIGLLRLWRWIGRHRAYRRLYPLWLALYRSSPGIALIPPSPRVVNALAVRDLNFRLYRRVIEIRDGCLTLRAFQDPQVADAARNLGRDAGLSGSKLEVLVEAASLAAGLRAMPTQRRAAVAPPTTIPARGGANLDTEVAWLAEVSDCFAHSPLLRAVLARMEREAWQAASGRVVPDRP